MTALVAIGAAVADHTCHAKELAIEPRFDEAGLFHEGIAPVKKGRLWGFIDKRGQYVVEPRYDVAVAGGDGRYGVQRGKLWVFISVTGEEVIEPRFDDAQQFSDNLAAVRVGKYWGYNDRDGEVVRPPKFALASPRREGLSLVLSGKTLTILPPYREQEKYKAEHKFPPDTEIKRVFGFSEGLGMVKTDKTHRYVDPRGKLVDALVVYSDARPYKEGRAAVKMAENRWIYIDKRGTWDRRKEWEGARDFSLGVAPVKKGGK